MGHFDKAIEMHEQCLAIMKKVGDCEGQSPKAAEAFCCVSLALGNCYRYPITTKALPEKKHCS